MGIPCYFSHIIKTYSNIIRNLLHFKNNRLFRFHNLYLDSNSIIYDVVRELETKNTEKGISMSIDVFEKSVIDNVLLAIEGYCRVVSPTKVFYIAFDGDAPMAKKIQQKMRRYKSHFMSTLNLEPATTETTVNSKWNTNEISPGTAFMNNLSSRVHSYFANKEKELNVDKIIVSCSNMKGEGEHKIFEHVRQCATTDDNIAIYGLDADLFMLSMYHLDLCRNIYVFREAPEFIKSSIPLKQQNTGSNLYCIDIQILCSGVLSEMNCLFFDKHRLRDYLLLCHFLGNDFVPHTPVLNLRTSGMSLLVDSYRECIGSKEGKFLISKETKEIEWPNVMKVLERIAKMERDILIEEMDKRRRWKGRFTGKQDEMKDAPMLLRAKEEYINPKEDGWRTRYKKALGNVESVDNYKRVIDGVNKYYDTGELTVYSKSRYGPLLTEVVRSDHSCVTTTPSMVLTELDIMPKKEDKFEIEMSYMRYDWEGEVKIWD
uniref:Xrn1 N-terminal domain-containing protein n=1 Tax=viral metagenome TaxID=1070528 RepID=A0A6C0I3T3_9ZZZZ